MAGSVHGIIQRDSNSSARQPRAPLESTAAEGLAACAAAHRAACTGAATHGAAGPFSRTIATAAADASMSLSWLTTSEAYKSPAFIALVSALAVAVLLLLHHCVLINCGHDRRRRRPSHQRRGVVATTAGSTGAQRGNDGDDEGEESVSVEASATSRTHLVAAAVVCRYRKEEAWKETTCPVCLADFDDGEAVRVLPECMHCFHAECIDTWLRGNTSCPMCRAETTPTPTPTPTPSPATTPTSASVRHHRELSVSLEEILVRS